MKRPSGIRYAGPAERSSEECESHPGNRIASAVDECYPVGQQRHLVIHCPGRMEAVVSWVGLVGGVAASVSATKRCAGDKVPDSARERTDPMLVIPLFFVGILLVPIVIGYARIGVLPSYLFYPGLILWIVGFALYAWSVRFLGRFQSGFVRVVAGHRVIQEGPYRLIRHPLYASELVTWIG